MIPDPDEPVNPFSLLTGLRNEPRGEFPAHDDIPRPRLTGEQAARIARDRLAEWRRTHGV